MLRAQHKSTGRIERHVPCFKRSHTVTLLSKGAAEGRRQERLAYVRAVPGTIMARVAMAFFALRSSVRRIARTPALGQAKCAAPIRHVRDPARPRSSSHNRDRDRLWGLCWLECATPFAVLACRECCPTRHNPLRREPQAKGSERHRPRNKAQSPAWSGGRVDVRVHTRDRRGPRDSAAPPECLRVLGWRISSRGHPRRFRAPLDSLAEKYRG